MAKIRVVLADDHSVLRVGLKAFLEEQREMQFEVVGEAASGEEVLELCETVTPDVLVLDLSMRGMGGMETTVEMKRRYRDVKIVVLTQYDDPVYLRRLLEAGAQGYVLKSARGEELITAIRSVMLGGTFIDPRLAGSVVDSALDKRPLQSAEQSYERLTPRERQVLKMIAEGYTNKEMAKSLGLAVKTVMTHRFNLMDKLGIHNHAKLVQFAIRVGLLPQP